MNDMDKIKELSQIIQDRLKNVKLAVSKANLNYNKMMELSKKQKLRFEKFNSMNKKKRKNNSAFHKDYSYNNKKISLLEDNSKISSAKKDIFNKKNKNEEKEPNFNNSLLKESIFFNKKESEKKDIKPRNIKRILPELKSQYALDRTKLNSPKDIFNKYHFDFSQGYKSLFRPFKKLFKKTKEPAKRLIRVKSSIISKGYKNNIKYFEENLEKEKEYLLEKRRKMNNLEKCLKKLEQNSYI